MVPEKTLTREDVEHVALLARVGLDEAEAALYREQLSVIFQHFQVLNELDTDNVAPTAQAIPLVSVYRDDVVADSLPQEQVLQNAPLVEDGFFRVRAVLE